MKTCTVYGDMSSDKSRDNYPTQTYCNDCFEGMSPDSEDTSIVTVNGYDSSLGDVCDNCGKTEAEEKEE